VNNLAELILERAERRAGARFGDVDDAMALGDAVALARRATGQLQSAGIGVGHRAALIGETSTSYLLAWMTLQLAGVEAALINPSLPDELLAAMVKDLDVDAVIWCERRPNEKLAPKSVHLDASKLSHGFFYIDGRPLSEGAVSLAGASRRSEDVAGYMHTSGTTGKPKFCTQSHRYFLELGRFVADSMALSSADTVFAPLPMFHINPMGYGVVGGLTGGSDVLATSRFSARRFWKTVKDEGVTVAFLHSPPVAVLNRATDANDAAGHRLRAVFLADEEFLKKFAVPMGFSAYGSTEAGGLCHIWPWRLGDRCTHPEGMSRFGGVPRRDVEWDLGDDGEILVRARRPHILSSGYRTASGTAELTDENGWFHTGDRGRRDENGHLVFIERKADSIRVKGEYVPIAFVEEAFAAIDEVEELALWRRDSELVDQEPILYVVASNDIPDDKIREVSQSLPRFMRPVAVVRVDALPRNEGVGKINRRRLETIEPLEVVELNQQR
jgi:crotonobetaine/carnitine-CoA ligase